MKKLCMFKLKKKCKSQKRFKRRCLENIAKMCPEGIGELDSDDGNANENATSKYNFISFVVSHDYFNSFNFYRNSKLPKLDQVSSLEVPSYFYF